MRDEKKIKAEILLEGIGEIDDALLAEAIAYRPRRRTTSRLLILAATIAVVFTLVVGNALISMLAKGDSDIEAIPEADEGEVAYTLDSVFNSLDDKERFKYIEDESDLPYFDGVAHVVWQYSGDEGYYVSDALTYNELETIKKEIGRGNHVGDDSPELECMVWVLLGDGRVVSPYLKASAGNIANEVFDYEAEIAPDESFVIRISNILS